MKLDDLRCEAVIAEPPFSTEFQLFEFLHFVAAHLTDSGAGFVVTRASVLDSRSDEMDRRDVLHANVLSAVVALPSKLLRHSPMPLALWVLQSPNTPANEGTEGSTSSTPATALKKNSPTWSPPDCSTKRMIRNPSGLALES